MSAIRRIAAAPAGWLHRRYRRMPLRVKLVATLLLLVGVALAGSGTVAVATLRPYLVGRVDAQLADALPLIRDHGLANLGKRPLHAGNSNPDDLNQARLPSAFVVEVTDAHGKVVFGPTSDLVNQNQPRPRLPHLSGANRRARTFTVGAQSGDSRWRVLATPFTLADGSTATLLVAQSLIDVDNTLNRLVLLSLVIGAATVGIIAAMGYVIVQASLRPLHKVEATAAKIAAGDLSHRVPDADPHTEVGQLSRALNAMLTEIETAFAERAASERAARRSEEQLRASEASARESEQRMRRFVADASHELRTPLTSIRGFAELYRQGAVTGRDEVHPLMRRIEDEAARMDMLVVDLLLLARVDQQRPLARAPVDLLALAVDAIHDAGAVDPKRPIRLQVGPADPPPVVIGDDARLRQVLANLVTNALKHTPHGTPVTIRVQTDQRMAVLTVTDQGPGMTRQDAAHVFDRFYRADPARSSDGGTGLGLAIVAALVAAHGGRVDLHTAHGQGASFRVELPLVTPPTRPA
jgi:two-component system, OmpR family, sensor kinase